MEVNTLKAELQKTRDELFTLKGEQGKPKIPISKKKPIDFFSEKERKPLNPTSEKKSKEKADIFRAGLESTRYQQIDDT
jgi:hypothetical protein